MIEFHQVSKIYPGKRVGLNKVSFKLAQGELAFLTGHSGAGKSTLLKLIAHIELPTLGEIIVDKRNVARIPHRDLPFYRRKLGMILQDPILLYDRSVFHNVALPLIMAGINHKELKARVGAALSHVGMSKKSQLMPRELSAGEQQRINIARTLANMPSIILADEPTGNLDPELARSIMQLFYTLSQTGVTIIIASHDIDLVREHQQRILHLEQGALVSDEKNQIKPAISASE
ncbi:cell division ATP-binding protein FtsE [Piscirickettsia litoralis]|uniref:Cell division ATP-binding protein FtsE n=1 Tax=Piscirickettsia litoralis TaxID=1891921 RepID=A0ABX3A3R1_9GAMM|nr:ATP-binding cassette domain-containing protein [Piscirickettsia litoralis]ODN43512.1 cell division ATP-binding protein FtsE [Piscirickettsia litoralis]